MLSYANLLFIQIITATISFLWVLDGAVFPFKKTSLWVGLTSSFLFLGTMLGMYFKSSEAMAKLYPQWLMVELGIFLVLVFLKLALRKKWSSRNIGWQVFAGLGFILMVYLHSYRPFQVF